MAGADAARMKPTRFAPYRAIVGHDQEEIGDTGYTMDVEVLECGHTLRPRSDMIGVTACARRRCVECLKAACGAAGHPLVDWFGPGNFHPERTFMRCKCAERDESEGK